MNTWPERSRLYTNFSQIVDLSKNLLVDFENLYDNKEILKKIPNAESAYLHAFIINISKILNDSKSDSYRLGQFKNICGKEIKKKIESVEKDYQDIIEKIMTNRHEIVAHLDKDFYEIPFSRDQISKWKKDMMVGMRITEAEAETTFAELPRAISKGQERYSPLDLKNDLPIIRELLEKMDKIWKGALLADYKNKKVFKS